MRYRAGYKYQLVDDFELQTCIYPKTAIVTPFITLTTKGLLCIGAGFAWDGPSGPTYDTEDFILASLPHDAFYLLMRLGLLDRAWRKAADELLRDMMIEGSGFLGKFRAMYAYRAVRMFAASAASPSNRKEIKEV